MAFTQRPLKPRQGAERGLAVAAAVVGLLVLFLASTRHHDSSSSSPAPAVAVQEVAATAGPSASPRKRATNAKKCPHGVLSDAKPSLSKNSLNIPLRAGTGKSSATPGTPLKIFTCGNDNNVPESLAGNVRRSRETLPEFRHLYFSERAMRTYIRHRHNTTVLDAFDSVRSLELKIELFKWLYLWTDGGIFVHLTATVTSKFRDMILKPELREQLVVSHDGSIVAAQAEHPLVRSILAQVMNTLSRRLYLKSLDEVGGKELLTTAIRSQSPTTSNASSVYLLPIKMVHGCAVSLLRFRSQTIGELGLGEADYLGIVKREEADFMWANRQLYYQDFVTDKERTDEELEARARCPFGHTEIISYHPVDTLVSEQILHKISSYDPVNDAVAIESNQKIPKVMMQTNKDSMVPEGMFEAVKALRALHPDYEHFYYSDTTARQFLIENTNDTFVEVFDTLIPGAYKADFFRYVWLYFNGGVYVDIDEVPLERIKLGPEDAFVSALDIPPNAVYNAFMAVTPFHPILDEAIRAIVHKVMHRSPCVDPLTHTGPIALGEAMRTHMRLEDDLKPDFNYEGGIRLIRYEKGHLCSIGYLVSEKRRLMVTRYPTYKRDMKWYGRHGGEHYWDQCRAQKFLSPIPVEEVDTAGTVRTEQEIEDIREQLLTERTCGSRMNASTFYREDPEVLPEAEIRRVPFGPGPLVKVQPKTTMIPLRFFFFGKTDELPSGFIDGIESFRRVHPTAEIEYYNETTAKQYIAFHMSTKLVALYEKLTVWEDKAQFFALISLLSRGGTYVRLGVTASTSLARLPGDAIFVEDSESGHRKISMDIVSCRPLFGAMGIAMQLRLKSTLKNLVSIPQCIMEALTIRSHSEEKTLVGGREYMDGKVRILWKKPSAPKCPDNEIGWNAANSYGLGAGVVKDSTPTIRQDVLALPKLWNEPPEQVFLPDSPLGKIYHTFSRKSSLQKDSEE